MRVSSAIAVLTTLLSTTGSYAFRPLLRPSSALTRQTRFLLKSVNNNNNLHEFEYLLGEQPQGLSNKQQLLSRRRIYLHDDRATVLTTNTFASPEISESTLEELSAEATEGATSDSGYDPYADLGMDEATPMVKKYEQQQSLPQQLENKLKTMDLQDIISTLIIPSVVAFAGLRWGFNRISTRVAGKADTILDGFAKEMIYHDGNFDEMKMCYDDYSKKLVWLGPQKTQSMLFRYLELYSKKKTVSPQSISSLSYVFSLFKLSEERAAGLLVSLCRKMGANKISSSGKLLFFGSRILKSPEGKAALEPIKDLIKSTYRDATVAETLVETSQRAMAEAAYRTAVQEAGKNQKSLTLGWEVLGLDKETATRIFEEEAEEGFVSAREQMYGGQSQKYDKKGRPIDKEGKLENPEDAEAAAEEETEEMPTSNVYECGECGYTLFIAKGREFKFYGDDFKCPECGAAKDKFEARDMTEE